MLACSPQASETPALVVPVQQAPADAGVLAIGAPSATAPTIPPPPPTTACSAAGTGPVVAEAAFRRGRAALDRNDLPTAKCELEASFNADPAVGTLLNLAMVEEKMGDKAGAVATYQRALTMNPSPDRAKVIRAHLQALGVP